ncbi:hypothetical protein SFRURICE_017781 [Spodoptera frugiperda]|nr:hypothetical protein SFRURICE_017781 [Spodoptera frugiperda]
MAQDSTSLVSILDSWEERIGRKFKEVQVQIQTAGTSKDTIASTSGVYPKWLARTVLLSLLAYAMQNLALTSLHLRSRSVTGWGRPAQTTTGPPPPGGFLGVRNFFFASTDDKMKVWKAKAGLKGSSVVIKEFLTRTRQSVFERARQHFSMRACWTNNGVIHIRAPDGSRHKVTSMDGLDPLLSKYPRTQGKSPSVGKRPAESAGGNLKGTRK